MKETQAWRLYDEARRSGDIPFIQKTLGNGEWWVTFRHHPKVQTEREYAEAMMSLKEPSRE